MAQRVSVLATSGFRWTLATLATLAVATGFILVAMMWRTNDLLTSQVLQGIAAEARSLNDQFRTGGLPALVQTVSERSKLAPDGGLYLMVDGAGIRLAGNLETIPAEILAAPGGGVFHYVPRIQPGVAPDRDVGATDRPARLAVGMPIRVTSQAQLFVARDIEDLSAFAERTRRLFLAGFALTALLALTGAALYSRNVLRRVDEMTAASRKIMAGDLSQRLPVLGRSDEMGQLSASLNLMLERIEQLLNGLREVSDNIAHDLKTPQTRLRNRAEAALRDQRGEPAYREGLERTLEEADELIKTFNALLSIARLEAGANAAHVDAIDLTALVQDAVELYEPVAEEAGLRIAYVAPAPTSTALPRPVSVMADRQLLGQAVANLIENAMKYGRTGSLQSENAGDPEPASGRGDGDADITASAGTHDGWADIIIADHGPGIPEADRERVLKRFVRLEISRTLPGTGLGLSLVAAVVRLHKGTIRLEDNGPGLRVVLSLPLVPPGTMTG